MAVEQLRESSLGKETRNRGHVPTLETLNLGNCDQCFSHSVREMERGEQKRMEFDQHLGLKVWILREGVDMDVSFRREVCLPV